ncbi:hypothetical protein HK104_006866 [Borealophlyctis nickersoniae]|nr:hypothetical protein HK104_006866 [Borealophlyctis nickersoniae]
MPIPYAQIAQQNRAKVVQNMHQAGVTSGFAYLKGGSTEVRKWTDTDAAFRQESNFFYLTGARVPDLHLLLDLSNSTSHLFLPNYDPDHVLWCGPSPSPKDAVEMYGVDRASYIADLAGELKKNENGQIHVLSGTDVAVLGEGKIVEDGVFKQAITEARVVKSEGELEIMRKAAKISGEAHVALMKAVRPGQGTEQELHALFEYECFRKGGRFQAYTPIVAAGKTGSILHYVRNADAVPADPSQLLLVDAACEVDCYAADITRTYPVGGRFEGDWKTTYEIVLAMQKAVLGAIKAGVEWEDMHRLANNVMLDGLLKAGLVKGSIPDLHAHHIPALFFPHGLGHSIGIDVHDVGGYPPGTERINEPGIKYLRMRRKLKEGMVVTVEPGCYFVDPILDKAVADPTISAFLNLDVLARFRRNVGGVRIEDDLVVLKDGIENLTGWVPKEIADIERVMGGK